MVFYAAFNSISAHIIHAFLGFTSTRLGSEVSCLRTLPRKKKNIFVDYIQILNDMKARKNVDLSTFCSFPVQLTAVSAQPTINKVGIQFFLFIL